MDDFKNSAQSVLGGSAKRAPSAVNASRGELLDINERLSYIQKRCSELASNLSQTSDRVFGAIPVGEDASAYAERGDGAAATLHITIDRIESILAAAEREAGRISRL